MSHFRVLPTASTMGRSWGDGQEDGNNTPLRNELRSSCDRCGVKKRRCDGGHPCRRCVRIGDPCTYTKRKSRAIKPSNDAQARQQYDGAVSFKRFRLSASPATGLVGMQENAFLSDYFCCVGFLPFTSQSNIRETMVNMFARPGGMQHSDSGDYSTREQHFDSIVPAGSQVIVDPSTCVFWSAVALGSLVQGRPIESVARYTRLARDALVNVSGPPNADVARAWAILAYMSDFCGDQDGFHEFVRQANDELRALGEEGDEALPVGLSAVVKHGESMKVFTGKADSQELESFCNHERATPQITEAATEGEICQFVMQSCKTFEQVLHDKVKEKSLASRDASAEVSTAKPMDAQLAPESSAHFIATLIRERKEGTAGDGMLDTMMGLIKQYSHQFQRLEQAADRPGMRGGIGALIINSNLVFANIGKGDIRGALEKLEKCREVFERYPGLCRFTMGSHILHMMMISLIVIADPTARAIFGKVRAAYNSALLPGARAIPPFDEWQGVADCCDNHNCRFMEFMANVDLGDDSSSPPPQEHTTQMQHEWPGSVPVDGRQQERVPLATGSRGGAEGIFAVDTRGSHATTGASRSAPEPERIDGEQPVRSMEHMSWDEERTALTRPQEPTSAVSLVRRSVSGPMIQQNISNNQAESRAQAAEEVFPPGIGAGQTLVVDETEHAQSIGGADWLDVTHAMLDTDPNGLGLDFE